MTAEQIKTLREVPENTYKIALTLTAQLKSLEILYRKATGFGSWALGTMLVSMILGVVTYRLFSARLPDYLNYQGRDQDIPLGALIFVLMFMIIIYAIGLAVAKSLYGAQLQNAREHLVRTFSETAPTEFLDALWFIETYQLAPIEAMPKQLKQKLKDHKKLKLALKARQ